MFQAIKPGKNAAYPNDEGFLRWLDGVRDFHLAAGLESVEIVTLHVAPLGESQTLVSVVWAVRFEKRSTLRIQFEISYVLSGIDTDHPKILSVISHADQRAAMRRHEVLP
jgi:hypothetical protein